MFKKGESMKIGDLIRVRHFGSSYNGKIGVVVAVFEEVGFRTGYAVRIPNLTYEIGLSREQCEVINEDR